jgi:hypothetical protein
MQKRVRFADHCATSNADARPPLSPQLPLRKITLADLDGTTCTVPSDHKRLIVGAGADAVAVAARLGYQLEVTG